MNVFEMNTKCKIVEEFEDVLYYIMKRITYNCTGYKGTGTYRIWIKQASNELIGLRIISEKRNGKHKNKSKLRKFFEIGLLSNRRLLVWQRPIGLQALKGLGQLEWSAGSANRSAAGMMLTRRE